MPSLHCLRTLRAREFVEGSNGARRRNEATRLSSSADTASPHACGKIFEMPYAALPQIQPSAATQSARETG